MIYYIIFLGFFIHIYSREPLFRLQHVLSPKEVQALMKSNVIERRKFLRDLYIMQKHALRSEEKEFGCFDLDLVQVVLPWLFSSEPAAATILTKFLLFSRVHRNPVLVNQNTKYLNPREVNFDANRETKIIIHGFMTYNNASWIRSMVDALLDWENLNVIVVDWSEGGYTWLYWNAVTNAQQVADEVVTFLQNITKSFKNRMYKARRIHCIGHSIGAHICGAASLKYGRFARITGLDPAQPCFRTTDITQRLDSSDAKYVDVIHTNGRLLEALGLGYPEPLGDADFFPNGGESQPGCDKENNIENYTDILQGIMTGWLSESVCSHGRAYEYFIEAVPRLNYCRFIALKWKNEHAVPEYSLRSCGRSCAEMGMHAVGGNGIVRAHGSYFVKTRDQKPYCKPSPKVQTISWHKKKNVTNVGTYWRFSLHYIVLVVILNRFLS